MPGAYRCQNRGQFPGIGIAGVCEPSCGCWDSILGPLEEQQPVLLITELPFQSYPSVLTMIGSGAQVMESENAP